MGNFEMLSDKVKKLAWCFGILLAVVVCFGLWRHLRQGIYYRDCFYYQKSDSVYHAHENEVEIERTGDSAIFHIMLNKKDMKAELTWSLKNTDYGSKYAHITYDDGTVVEGIWSDDNQLVNEEGLPLFLNDEIIVTFDDESEPVQHYALSDFLCKADLGITESRGMLVILLFGVILYAIGALTFLFPNKMHFLFSRWQYKDAELSEEGIFFEKAGGLAGMIAGCIFILNLIPM